MCKYCEPYHEEQIAGENGYAYVTKYGELVVFPDTDFEVCAVHLPIKFCPMCVSCSDGIPMLETQAAMSLDWWKDILNNKKFSK